VILYAAGEPHGMHNPGRTTAKYVVFEFHRQGIGLPTRLRGFAKARLVRRRA
jgi:hypothetical protein